MSQPRHRRVEIIVEWGSRDKARRIALAPGKDSSNYFSTAQPVDGPFPDSVLSQTNGASPGHGQFIVNWMRQ
jgi:hypothetical protein